MICEPNELDNHDIYCDALLDVKTHHFHCLFATLTNDVDDNLRGLSIT